MRVKITPPNKIPQAKYGQAVSNKITDQNNFDTRWNTDSYQGQIGVNPDPNPYACTGNTLPEVSPEEANVNAEKNEQVLGNFTPDGLPSLMNVDGPPHTQGGKDISVPDGSFIFSDTKALKIKDPEVLKQFGQSKSSTPAQIAKQYQLQKFTKVIADPKSDNVSKKTAELMVKNYTDKLNSLAQLQEGMKQGMGIGDNPQTQPQPPIAQYGGKGDDVGDQNNYPALVANYNGDNNPYNHPNRNYGQSAPSPITNPGPIAEQNWTGYGAAPKAYDYHDLGSDSSSSLPTLPGAIPQPNNMQTPSNPDTRFGSSTITDTKKPEYTNVPFTAPTPDRYGMMNSFYNAATLHKIPAWEAPISAIAPTTVYEDPTRAIAALNEQSNSAGYNSMLSGNSKASRANQLAYQNADQIANVLGSTANRNTQIANQASRENADISNKLQFEQARRLSDIYKGNAIASQQYDNAQREARQDITRQAQTSWNDRSKLDFLNKTSPYFYVYPTTGARSFKSPEAEAHFNNEINHIGEGMGLGKDGAKKYVEAYKYALANGVTNDEDARKYAREAAGWTDREREKFSNYGVPQGETTSRSGVEFKYGGKTNFNSRKLKKFMK